jgi:ATP-dependent Clp protease adaptor protein ClpS
MRISTNDTIQAGSELSATEKTAGIITMSRFYGDVDEGGNVLLAQPKVRVERPPMYKVILLNDDYTPMEFVVKVLENIFHKEGNEAVRVMMEVHNKGAGICGIFTRDVAETKTDQTLYLARQHEYPLQCVMEKE